MLSISGSSCACWLVGGRTSYFPQIPTSCQAVCCDTSRKIPHDDSTMTSSVPFALEAGVLAGLRWGGGPTGLLGNVKGYKQEGPAQLYHDLVCTMCLASAAQGFEESGQVGAARSETA